MSYEWPLKRKYRPRGQWKDYMSQKGHGRTHGGNNRREEKRHKLDASEKARGLFGYRVFVPRVFRLVGGKLR